MRLNLHSQLLDDVVVVRCQGRLVSGAEVDAFESELDKQTKLRKRVVLQLAETEYVDSSGLGAIVRLLGVLRSSGGDLKLCQVSPFVLQMLQVTNLLTIFVPYASEREAVEAFSKARRTPQDVLEPSGTKILCIDTSSDLLAYVSAVLKRAGHQVFTSRYLGEAITLVNVTRPDLVICGPGFQKLPTGEEALEKFRQSRPNLQVLHLPPDFSTSEAGQAGADLVNHVQSLLTA
jgi:anti-sigma B factor antagonist